MKCSVPLLILVFTLIHNLALKCDTECVTSDNSKHGRLLLGISLSALTRMAVTLVVSCVTECPWQEPTMAQWEHISFCSEIQNQSSSDSCSTHNSDSTENIPDSVSEVVDADVARTKGGSSFVGDSFGGRLLLKEDGEKSCGSNSIFLRSIFEPCSLLSRSADTLAMELVSGFVPMAQM